MCEIVYNILITNFTVHRCIIRSNAPSNLQMQPIGCIFVYALNCITFGTAIDPACKSGVFLREIAKRLIKGLEDQIPDLNERLDHIFKNQIYGIAITELTSLLSRRSLYCSKFASSKYSVVKFEKADGNVRFKKIPHSFENGKCVYCGASEKEYGKEKRDNQERGQCQRLYPGRNRHHLEGCGWKHHADSAGFGNGLHAVDQHRRLDAELR